MDDKRKILRHVLATLAYRTQKALRGAPASFAEFRAAPDVWTPHELVWHMTWVLAYARTCFEGGTGRPEKLPGYKDEIFRFHGILEDLGRHLDRGTPLRQWTLEQLLQGPFADAMTHAGQLAMLRRLAGCPIVKENYITAAVDPANLGPDQPNQLSAGQTGNEGRSADCRRSCLNGSGSTKPL